MLDTGGRVIKIKPKKDCLWDKANSWVITFEVIVSPDVNPEMKKYLKLNCYGRFYESCLDSKPFCNSSQSHLFQGLCATKAKRSKLALVSVRREIPYNDGIYFITITCTQWLHLFEIACGYDSVYKWFDHLRSQGHYIVGYVIMPNHLHALIGFRNTQGESINKIIGEGKRFMSYFLVKKLKEKNANEELLRMSTQVNDTDGKRGKLHQVFEPSFDWKECISNEFIDQKLDYIHANPCRGLWELVKEEQEYVHSSAKYYATGEQGIYSVTNYIELEDIDLTGSGVK